MTPREREVLTLLAEGRSNAEISLALGISANTVKWHLRHLFERFDASTRTETVVRAMREGVLT